MVSWGEKNKNQKLGEKNKRGKEKKEENYIKKGDKGLKNAYFWTINSIKIICRGKKLNLKKGGREMIRMQASKGLTPLKLIGHKIFFRIFKNGIFLSGQALIPPTLMDGPLKKTVFFRLPLLTQIYFLHSKRILQRSIVHDFVLVSGLYMLNMLQAICYGCGCGCGSLIYQKQDHLRTRVMPYLI